MNDAKIWRTGVTIILAFVIFSEITIIFKEYFYFRLGLNRNLITISLWILPTIASFLVVYFSKKRIVLKAFSLILLLSSLGPLGHFISGEIGATIDLGGLPGIRITIPIYLALSTIAIGFGFAAAVLLKKDGS